MDGYPGMVLPGFFPDLVLSGRLPWHGFAWMVVVTLTWFCVARIPTFPVFSQPRNNPGRIRWTKFFRDGLQSSHLCRMHTPVPQSKHYSGSDHLYTVKIQFELIKIKVEGFYARNLP